MGLLGFEPTYKEWKPQRVKRALRVSVLVLSLPTRNGNRTLEGGWLTRLSCFEPTYKEWKLSIATVILNIGICFEPTYKEWKCSSFSPSPPLSPPSFEPTYKEWKCSLTVSLPLHSTRFEPTYKEWKREASHQVDLIEQGF